MCVCKYIYIYMYVYMHNVIFGNVTSTFVTLVGLVMLPSLTFTLDADAAALSTHVITHVITQVYG